MLPSPTKPRNCSAMNESIHGERTASEPQDRGDRTHRATDGHFGSAARHCELAARLAARLRRHPRQRHTSLSSRHRQLTSLRRKSLSVDTRSNRSNALDRTRCNFLRNGVSPSNEAEGCLRITSSRRFGAALTGRKESQNMLPILRRSLGIACLDQG